MRGKGVYLDVICDFECWRGGDGSKIVVSVVMVLWEVVMMEMM